MLTKGKLPSDSVEDIDAELKLAAADPSKHRDHDRWLKWLDELLERRTAAAKRP